jgi:hypothetical protein
MASSASYDDRSTDRSVGVGNIYESLGLSSARNSRIDSRKDTTNSKSLIYEQLYTDIVIDKSTTEADAVNYTYTRILDTTPNWCQQKDGR